MKKFILFLLASFMLVSCNNGKKMTIFEIGDTREHVINTIVNDFTIEGKKWTKDMVLKKENGNHITLYDCKYKGQDYYKVRVYYSNEKVARIELKIDADKTSSILDKLSDETGRLPHHMDVQISKLNYFFDDLALLDDDRDEDIPYYVAFPIIHADVFLRDDYAIIVTDEKPYNLELDNVTPKKDYYYIRVVSELERSEWNNIEL